MTQNTADLQYTSLYPIDKITQQGTASYTVAGSSDPTTPTYSLQTIPNTSGKKSFVNMSWSIDTVNFQDQQSALYFNSSFFVGAQILKFQAQAGSDASNIYFFLQNGFSDGSGNPLSQTVTLNYAIYSIL